MATLVDIRKRGYNYTILYEQHTNLHTVTVYHVQKLTIGMATGKFLPTVLQDAINQCEDEQKQVEA